MVYMSANTAWCDNLVVSGASHCVIHCSVAVKARNVITFRDTSSMAATANVKCTVLLGTSAIAVASLSAPTWYCLYYRLGTGRLTGWDWNWLSILFSPTRICLWGCVWLVNGGQHCTLQGQMKSILHCWKRVSTVLIYCSETCMPRSESSESKASLVYTLTVDSLAWSMILGVISWVGSSTNSPSAGISSWPPHK